MGTSLPGLSLAFQETAFAERTELIRRYEIAREESVQHAELSAAAAQKAGRYLRAIREIGEILGLEDQLSICGLSDALRGERLREVAADVLWRHFQAGDIVHYKQWYDLVIKEGHRVGGKNPWATFLTQIAHVETVERVGRRTGLYQLRAA